MVRVRSILAATDFSDGARHAVERAALLGATIGAQRCVLLHVLQQSWLDALRQFMSTPEEVEQRILHDARRSVTEWVEEVRQRSDLPLEPQVRTGNTTEAIVEAAADFDLLVLGARGRHPVRALALGTTSQRLLHKVQQPILVVKQRPERPYQRVFVAVDFSPNSRKALAYSRVIAPDASVYAVHVFQALFESKMLSAGASAAAIEEYRTRALLEAKKEMSLVVADAGLDPRSLVRTIEHGHAPAKLPEIARKWGSDLIIVGKHGRSRIGELLLGSVPLHLLAQSRCDVLVVA